MQGASSRGPVQPVCRSPAKPGFILNYCTAAVGKTPYYVNGITAVEFPCAAPANLSLISPFALVGCRLTCKYFDLTDVARALGAEKS